MREADALKSTQIRARACEERHLHWMHVGRWVSCVTPVSLDHLG